MRLRHLAAVLALLPFIAPGHAISAEQYPVVGLWQALDDDTKQPTGWFLISDHGGVFDGIIAKMFLRPDEDPNAICDQCKDDRRNHTWLGLEIIRGMKPEGDKFVDGTILDPRDGKIYKSTMKLTPDGQTLVVRGYIGISLLGRNQYWTRLPDSAYSVLDPSVLPAPAAVPKPATAPSRKPQMAPQPQNLPRQ
jgi:uncharacterized protein (DUF2147 family)